MSASPPEGGAPCGEVANQPTTTSLAETLRWRARRLAWWEMSTATCFGFLFLFLFLEKRIGEAAEGGGEEKGV